MDWEMFKTNLLKESEKQRDTVLKLQKTAGIIGGIVSSNTVQKYFNIADTLEAIANCIENDKPNP